MGLKLKPLSDQTLVITGASSGIGLATAYEAARQGARVVLVARNEEALQDIERQIIENGGQAMSITADVMQRADLQRVSEETIKRFGGFDTWINNAGVSIWGKMEQVSDADHRRLFDINFWGLVYGSQVAAEHLKSRGGAIINLGSVASDIGLPLQGMYCASKHAVKGFTDAFRLELEQAKAPISVTLIKPTSIDTPFPQHARNYMENEPKLPDPVYSPEEAAAAILHAATHPVRDIYVGGSAIAMSAFGAAAPRVMDWINEHVMFGQQKRNEAPRNPQGSLFHPGHDGQVSGDHPGYVLRRSLYTRAATSPVLSTAMVTAGIALLALLAGRNHGESPGYSELPDPSDQYSDEQAYRRAIQRR